jgi:hypothetical protein
MTFLRCGERGWGRGKAEKSRGRVSRATGVLDRGAPSARSATLQPHPPFLQAQTLRPSSSRHCPIHPPTHPPTHPSIHSFPCRTSRHRICIDWSSACKGISRTFHLPRLFARLRMPVRGATLYYWLRGVLYAGGSLWRRLLRSRARTALWCESTWPGQAAHPAGSYKYSYLSQRFQPSYKYCYLS